MHVACSKLLHTMGPCTLLYSLMIIVQKYGLGLLRRRYGYWGVHQVQNPTGKKIKTIKNDNGSEYMLTKFEIILKVKEFDMRNSTIYPGEQGCCNMESISLVKTTNCLCLQISLQTGYQVGMYLVEQTTDKGSPIMNT